VQRRLDQKSDEQTHALEPPIQSVVNGKSLGGGPVMLVVIGLKLSDSRDNSQELASMQFDEILPRRSHSQMTQHRIFVIAAFGISLLLGCGDSSKSNTPSLIGDGSAPKYYEAKIVDEFHGIAGPWYIVTITFTSDAHQDFSWRKDALDRSRYTVITYPPDQTFTLKFGELNDREFTVLWNEGEVPLKPGSQLITLPPPQEDTN
jgi:hypothetical protein